MLFLEHDLLMLYVYQKHRSSNFRSEEWTSFRGSGGWSGEGLREED